MILVYLSTEITSNIGFRYIYKRRLDQSFEEPTYTDLTFSCITSSKRSVENVIFFFDFESLKLVYNLTEPCEIKVLRVKQSQVEIRKKLRPVPPIFDQSMVHPEDKETYTQLFEASYQVFRARKV